MENSRGICPIAHRLAAIFLSQQVIDNPHQGAIKLIKKVLQRLNRGCLIVI